MNLLSKTSLKDLFEDAQQRMLSQRKLVNQLQEFSEYALEKKEITDEATRNDYINAYVELAARAMVYGGERTIQLDDINDVIRDKETISSAINYHKFLTIAFHMAPLNRNQFLWSNYQGIHSVIFYKDLQSEYLERTQ
ncbi:hypothetical protein K5B43_000688 [Vibrio parahaemolyticus]|nr:hypothetical protein [Vibrio parahaemolyticus]